MGVCKGTECRRPAVLVGADPGTGTQLGSAMELTAASGSNSRAFSMWSLLLASLGSRRENCKPIHTAPGYLEMPRVMQLENAFPVGRGRVEAVR